MSVTWLARQPYAVTEFVEPPAILGFGYEATTAGTSGTVEPAWPLAAGGTVVDGTVTWTARTATTITWTASPLYKSGATTPTFPTAVGATFTDNGITWTTRTPAITDKKCPQSKIAFAIASKVYSPYKDVTRYSATNSPRDWSTQDDAGFLPTGQHSPTSVETTAMAEYRGRLAIWTASHLQIWTVDPDPAENALFDSIAGIGTVYPKAVTSVSGDLFFTTRLGIRSVSIAAGAENLQTDDVGTPIDPLVQAKLAGPEMPIGMYYPGSGQFWMCFNSYDGAGGGSGGVGGVLALTCAPPAGLFGEAYTYTYTATGGTAPYTFTVVSGTLPPGLTLNGATGVLSGTPTVTGTYSFGVKVTDSRGVIAYCGWSSTVVEDVVPVRKTYLLVTGTEKAAGGPVFAVATPSLAFTGIPISIGANLLAATPAYYGGTWVAATNASVRYSTDILAAWQTGTISAPSPIDKVVGMSAGWLTVTSNYTDGPPFVASTPAAFTGAVVSALDSRLADASSQAQAAPIVFTAGGFYFLGRGYYLFYSANPSGPYTALWDVNAEGDKFGRPGTVVIRAIYDIAEFNGEWYGVILWGTDSSNYRYKIIKWSSLTNLTTITVLVDVARAATNKPINFCVGGGHLVCQATAGAIWTSANSWASAISTGIGGPTYDATYDLYYYTSEAPRIAYTNGLFHIIGITDQLVTFNPATLVMSAPITLPIAGTKGIVVGLGA